MDLVCVKRGRTVSWRKCEARREDSSLSVFPCCPAWTAEMAADGSVWSGLRSCQAITTSRASFIQGPGLVFKALASSVPVIRGLKVWASRME